MAPYKYEEKIKDTLEKRTLQPSKHAWEKLSNRLDNEENKSNNRSYLWLGIAASIVGVVFIVSQFLNNDINIKTNTKVVTTPKEVIQQEGTVKTALEGIEKVHIETVNEDVKEVNKKFKTKKAEAKKLINTNSLNKTKIAISRENIPQVQQIEITNQALTFEEQKIQEVVAQVNVLKQNNKKVTDADIDALLQEAQKEIKLNRLVNETSGVVDANLLLQDVEAELDQSFRNKVFEAIRSSYNSVKTAVAQRND